GEAGLNVGGTSVLPTAQASDIDSGALKGLVVPAGVADPDAAAALDDVIVRAHAKGAPLFAFGDGVPAALRALGRPGEAFAEAAAAGGAGAAPRPPAGSAALGAAAARVGRRPRSPSPGGRGGACGLTARPAPPAQPQSAPATSPPADRRARAARCGCA